jgi:hypothetical protein
VQRRARGAQAEAAAEPVDQEQGGDLADPRLDRLETDELGVEFGQDVRYGRLFLDGPEVEEFVGRELCFAGRARTCPPWWLP